LVKREYEESLEAAQTRLESLLGVERQLKRTDAQLNSLTSQLNYALTEIIRIQALEPAQAKDQVSPVVQKLAQQLDELRLFSQEVSQM
jgi:response regulator RpfG family c-di-GMP phosphodiesterase